MFDNEFDDLEKEFNQNNVGSANPFGQSTTKELLAQSRKEIMEDDLHTKELPKKKKDLAIEIDETEDYEMQNDAANQLLNQNL